MEQPQKLGWLLSTGGQWWRFGLGVRKGVIGREAFRVSKVEPNVAAGLRAGLATLGPLSFSLFMPRPELAIASLAGFSVVLADKGGAYHIRAWSMFAVALGGAAVTCWGALAGDRLLPTALLLGITVAAAGLLRIYGAAATSVGTMLAMAAIVAGARPAADVRSALSHAQFYLLGAAWASFLSLALWPLRAYRPARLACAVVLRKLGALAASLRDARADASAQVARRAQIGEARTAIEVARAQLGTIRRGRPGPTPRGERLLAVVEAADLLLGAIVAAEDQLAFAPPRQVPHLLAWIGQVGVHVDETLLSLAEGLAAEKPVVLPHTDIGELSHGITWNAQNPEDLEFRILNRVLERVDRLVEFVRGVDEPVAMPPPRQSMPPLSRERSTVWTQLVGQLTLDSAIFRHALRSSAATVATVGLVWGLGWDHGYWATLTCFVIMQPHGTDTWAKAVQRVVGSVIGAGVAVLVATWVSAAVAVMAWVFVCVWIAVALLPLNYGAYTVFLTPAFVLLAETRAGDESLSLVRVVSTLLGAIVALLASRLLFPLSERDQIRPLVASALRELDALLALVAVPEPQLRPIRAARRVLGLSLLNAEASHQRLLSETGLSPSQVDAVQTLLLYAHRMASGLIALAFAGGTAVHRELVDESPALSAGLLELSRAVGEQRPPAEQKEQVSDAGAPRVRQLFEQLAVLRAASCRFLGQSTLPS